MRNIHSIITLCLLSLTCVKATHADTRLAKPNIVLILTDDLGWQDVACYYRDQHDEEPFYETPHLDRIAERGIRFTQAYSPAMTCAPSRAAYPTGQWTPHNGVYHVNMGCNSPVAQSDQIPQNPRRSTSNTKLVPARL